MKSYWSRVGPLLQYDLCLRRRRNLDSETGTYRGKIPWRDAGRRWPFTSWGDFLEQILLLQLDFGLVASKNETVHFCCFRHPGFYTFLWQPLQTSTDTKADFSPLAKSEMVCETLSIALRLGQNDGLLSPCPLRAHDHSLSVPSK